MMETAITDALVEKLGSLPERVGASACFGTPVEREGHTLIPVARVSFGYGLGFGRGSGPQAGYSGNGTKSEGEGEGGGGGGGGSSAPVAVIDISQGRVEVQPITDPTRIALTSMTVGAWIAFWALWTVRTVARERQKTQRHRIDKGLV
jgi:uncharacterized spore protein YtfJ